jgi:hypothetical protein
VADVLLREEVRRKRETDLVLREMPEDLLKSVYRRMTKKWHPDAGGHVRAMQAVNDFYHTLVDEIEFYLE